MSDQPKPDEGVPEQKPPATEGTVPAEGTVPGEDDSSKYPPKPDEDPVIEEIEKIERSIEPDDDDKPQE